VIGRVVRVDLDQRFGIRGAGGPIAEAIEKAGPALEAGDVLRVELQTGGESLATTRQVFRIHPDPAALRPQRRGGTGGHAAIDLDLRFLEQSLPAEIGCGSRPILVPCGRREGAWGVHDVATADLSVEFVLRGAGIFQQLADFRRGEPRVQNANFGGRAGHRRGGHGRAAHDQFDAPERRGKNANTRRGEIHGGGAEVREGGELVLIVDGRDGQDIGEEQRENGGRAGEDVDVLGFVAGRRNEEHIWILPKHDGPREAMIDVAIPDELVVLALGRRLGGAPREFAGVLDQLHDLNRTPEDPVHIGAEAHVDDTRATALDKTAEGAGVGNLLEANRSEIAVDELFHGGALSRHGEDGFLAIEVGGGAAELSPGQPAT
jgi:hypothetical protein